MRRIIIGVLAALLLIGCATAPPGPSTPAGTRALDAPTLEAIRDTRVFFGHRSVGAEIIERGIPAVYRQYGLPPLAVGGDDHARFWDLWLEQTDDPLVKLASFREALGRDDLGDTVDIAFMKLGYVDIVAETDVASLFEQYRTMMVDVEATYPRTRFLHATVTPTRYAPEANVNIEAFNELMRDSYRDQGTLIDLADVLSRCPDGTIDRHQTEQGAPYVQICQAHTRDGGHLSDAGAVVAATELLTVIGVNQRDLPRSGGRS